jgi:hypothetical protein
MKYGFHYIVYPVIIILSLLVAGRVFGIGPDYPSYKIIFSSPDISIEPFFSFLRNINLLLFHNNIFVLYFLVSMIALILKFRFITVYSHNFFFSFVFYIFTFFFLHEYTQIRTAIAVGVFFLALDDIIHHKIGHYVFKTIIALLFHYSSILMLIVYFYCNCFKKKILFYVLFPWFIFIFDIFFIDILKIKNILFKIISDVSQKENYLGMVGLYVRSHMGHLDNELNVFNKVYLSLLIICSFTYYAYNGFKEKKYEKDCFLFKILSFTVASFYLLLNLPLPVLVFRISEYFLPVVSVILPNLSIRIKERQIFAIALCVYMFFLSYLFLTRTTSL